MRNFKYWFRRFLYFFVTKKMLISIIIFLIIVILSEDVFAYTGEVMTDADTSGNQDIVPTQDMYYILDSAYQKAEATFLCYAQFILHRNDQASKDAVNTFMNSIAYGNSVYYSYYETGVITAIAYRCYPTSVGHTHYQPLGTTGQYAFSSIEMIDLTSASNYIYLYTLNLRNRTMTVSAQPSGTFTIPFWFYKYSGSLTTEFILKNLYGEDSQYDQMLSTLSTQLQGIEMRQMDTNDNLEDVKDAIDVTNSKIDETNDSLDIMSLILTAISQTSDDTNKEVKEIHKTMKDSNISSGASDLPSNNTQDPTESGVNNIFSTLQSAFTTGTAQDIVVPVPFTNKTFTIPANLTINVLNGSQFSWVKTIIEAFWWYIIAKFIVQDISNKVRGIKSGNVENIQNDNIKEEML